MKKIVSLMLMTLVLSLSVPLFSQDTSDSIKVNVFKEFSLQFRVRFLELSSFQGSLISFKYHFNDNFAIRSGIGFSMSTNDSEKERELYDYGGDTLFTKIKADEENYSISVPIQFLYYFNPQNEIKFFVGLGPYFSFSTEERIENDLSEPNDKYYANLRNSESKNYFLGISAVYGVEWFFTDKMSLTGEYGFRFGYYYGEGTSSVTREYPDDIVYIEHTKSKGDGWRFISNLVLFGLSVYF